MFRTIAAGLAARPRDTMTLEDYGIAAVVALFVAALVAFAAFALSTI